MPHFLHKKRKPFIKAPEAISKVSCGFFISTYFAIVGVKLDFIHGAFIWMVIIFVVATSGAKELSASLAGWFADFSNLDLVNHSIMTNVRGDPALYWQAMPLMPGSSVRVLHGAGGSRGRHLADRRSVAGASAALRTMLCIHSACYAP
ncbi:MAG: hypothetical protein ABI158_10240 [Edaphobacter sp.]